MRARLLISTAWLALLPLAAMAKPAAHKAAPPAIAPAPAPAETPPVDPDAPVDYNTVLLQGLNKVTGHISKLEAPIGTVMRFGNLEIIARHCWKSPPEDQPENAALLEIRELKPGEEPKKLFLGWMFSSSPGLSGLEDPVYDITMLACEALADPEKKASE